MGLAERVACPVQRVVCRMECYFQALVKVEQRSNCAVNCSTAGLVYSDINALASVDVAS